jgi:ankyrin repeat protein
MSVSNNDTDSEGYGSKLIEYCKTNNFNEMRFLLNRTDKLCFINYKDKTEFTALHYAASKGKSDMVSLLLAEGANPTIFNNSFVSSFILLFISYYYLCFHIVAWLDGASFCSF